jgi:radical SAM family uncharacterized protein/radical SAM-linked protein
MNDVLRKNIESKILPVVQKPMRYMGGELNCVRKDLSNIDIHGVFCFPDLYDIGMSHFGLQILYHIVNKHKRWALSRAFHPWTDAENKMRECKIPLYSLEYFTPVKDADWIGFTIQYELQYTNIVNMLDLSGITIFQDKRQENEPIVIAGGPCVSNPEPLSPFIDAFAIGDGEKTIESICETLDLMKKKGATRKEKLIALSKIPGMYIPSMHEYCRDGKFVVPKTNVMVKAAKIQSLDNENYPSRPVVPLMDVIHNRLSVEVMRGCTRSCRFCSAGTYYRPVREREAENVFTTIKTGVSETGFKDVGLLSLSTADYSCLSGLLELASEIKEMYHISLSLPSTRIDSLTDDQLKQLDSVSPVSSMTIAPEAASIRLRKVINKDFTNEAIFETVGKLLANNIQTLKLYFMIGLPTETPEDIDAIISMVTTISGKVRAASNRRSLNVSISPFSPKPHTPFQREKMEPVDVLLGKGKLIKQSLKHLRNVKVSYRDPEITLLETVMARGDRAVGQLIYEAWKNGAKFDGWDEYFKFDRWVTSAQKIGLNLSFYTEIIDDSQILPWQMISTGVSQQFLIEERNKALQQITTADCRSGQCSACGVCGNGLLPVFRKETPHTKSKNGKRIVESSISTNENHNYRIYYDKGDKLRFLGHLDMSAIVHRAFMMGKIPLAFSNGFNPHPKISFGPPLPLGVAGRNEAFDFVTTAPCVLDLSVLNKWLPEELLLKTIVPMQDRHESLSAAIKAAKYLFRPLENLSIDDFGALFNNLLNREMIEIQIEKNGQIIRKNLRKGIFELNVLSDNAFEAVLAIQDGITCKPLELIPVLFENYTLNDFSVCRIECYEKDGNLLKKI